MQDKKQITINEKAETILKAISTLAREKKNINAHSIAKLTGYQWRTVKDYLQNQLKLIRV